MVRNIPKNFEKEYLKYFNNELTRDNIQKMFGISRRTVVVWAKKLNLPIKRTGRPGFPKAKKEAFQGLYTKFLNSEISRRELCKRLNISAKTCKNWRTEYNLPVKSIPKESWFNSFKKTLFNFKNELITRLSTSAKKDSSKKDCQPLPLDEFDEFMKY